MRFIFQHTPLWSTHFFHQCCSTWIPITIETHPRKSPELQIDIMYNVCDLIIGHLVWYCFLSNAFGGQKIISWCQSSRRWRVINQFRETVMPNSHCYYRLVCRSIVLVEQDSLRPFGSFPGRSEMFLNYLNPEKSWITYPVWVYLEGNNAVSIRKTWISCMPSFTVA